MKRIIFSRHFVVAIAMIGIAGSAEAAVTHWTVQSASSSLTLSGTLASGGNIIFHLEPLGAGSLVTKYNGTITTQQDVIAGSPTTIQILSSSLLASNNGIWSPLPGGTTGSAPANYGIGYIEFVPIVQVALRDLELELTSGVLPLSGSIPFQLFDSIYTLEFLSGKIDYRLPTAGLGGTALAQDPINQFMNLSAIDYGPTETLLAIPLNLGFTSVVSGSDTTSTTDDIELSYQLIGTIVATAPTASVPEASSLALLGLAGSIVGFVGYRRKTRNLNEVIRRQ